MKIFESEKHENCSAMNQLEDRDLKLMAEQFFYLSILNYEVILPIRSDSKHR